MAIHKQQTEPLFSDVVWAQPERAEGRNQVLIIGGHSHALQAPLDTFRLLKERKLGAGVILPDVLRDLLKFGRPADLDLTFAPSTPAGSLARAGKEAILAAAATHDCLFIVGDLSSNQETKQLAAEIVGDFKGLKLITGQLAVDFLDTEREDADLNLILSASQLTHCLRGAGHKGQGLPAAESLGRMLAELEVGCNLTACCDNILWTKADGRVCATYIAGFKDSDDNRLGVAVESASYLVNNPGRPWPALVSAAWQSRLNRE